MRKFIRGQKQKMSETVEEQLETNYLESSYPEYVTGKDGKEN